MRRVLLITLVVCFVALGPRAAAADAPPGPPERSLTCGEIGAHTGRLYRTMFGRDADRAGLLYWLGQRYRGLSGEDIAHWMSQGAEFQHLYSHLDDAAYVSSVYRNLLGRDPDPEGLGYWNELVVFHGRANVASWMTQTPEFAIVWPYASSPSCDKASRLGLTEVRPGLHVGRSGSTVTVVAERDLVDYRAVATGHTHARAVPGDVVVNANWFDGRGTVGPLVTGGRATGGPDLTERGQIVGWKPECTGGGEMVFEHIWTWRIWTPDDCVATAVSGVSLIHQGLRADAFPGIDLVSGYTNTNPAHSFIGFNDTELIVIATYEMNASRLADYALTLGVREGVMLDGGGSTQIRTPLTSLSTVRAVPTFAVLDSRAR